MFIKSTGEITVIFGRVDLPRKLTSADALPAPDTSTPRGASFTESELANPSVHVAAVEPGQSRGSAGDF